MKDSESKSQHAVAEQFGIDVVAVNNILNRKIELMSYDDDNCNQISSQRDCIYSNFRCISDILHTRFYPIHDADISYIIYVHFIHLYSYLDNSTNTQHIGSAKMHRVNNTQNKQ